MRLPPVDLIKFDGDPLKYWQFILLFAIIVEKDSVPDEEKLTRLHHYTTGHAQSPIAHCLYHPLSSVGYAQAMAMLKKRFSSPYTISQAWVDKVLTYKPIRDNKQLPGFADTLRSCSDSLKAMGCEDELNGGRALLQIIEKLPTEIKRKWLTVNHGITGSERVAKLDDVVQLIESEAEKRSDPIFGSLLSQNVPANNRSASNKSSPKPKKIQSFAAETKATGIKPRESSLRCPNCSEGHYLNQCSSFRGMSVQERLNLVRPKKLCQNCFVPGLLSDACTRTWVCKVPGCGLKRNSWHSAVVATTNDNNNNNNNNNPSTSATVSEPITDQPPEVQAKATRKSVQPSGMKITLPIVPVIVSGTNNCFSMNVFALLDDGANGTFCSKKLIRALRLETQRRSIKSSNMGV